jgi:hypothetical protein
MLVRVLVIHFLGFGVHRPSSRVPCGVRSGPGLGAEFESAVAPDLSGEFGMLSLWAHVGVGVRMCVRESERMIWRAGANDNTTVH